MKNPDQEPQLPVSEPVKTNPLWRVLLRGFTKRCPQCGKAPIYERYLKPTPRCASCGTGYDHIRTDDFAPWLTLIVLGHLFVPLTFHIETAYRPPLPLLFVVLVPSVTLAVLGLLPNFKGAAIAFMWSLGLRGDEQH